MYLIENCTESIKYFFGVTESFFFFLIADLVMVDVMNTLILFLFKQRRESIQIKRQYIYWVVAEMGERWWWG